MIIRAGCLVSFHFLWLAEAEVWQGDISFSNIAEYLFSGNAIAKNRDKSCRPANPIDTCGNQIGKILIRIDRIDILECRAVIDRSGPIKRPAISRSRDDLNQRKRRV